MKDFKNEIIQEFPDSAYASFLLELRKCPICQKWMLPKDKGDYNTSFFIHSNGKNQEDQMKQLGVVFMGSYSAHRDNYICVECTQTGKDFFTCALCQQPRSFDQEQKSIGIPADILCKVCYATVSAKVWHDKIQDLEILHEYDAE